MRNADSFINGTGTVSSKRSKCKALGLGPAEVATSMHSGVSHDAANERSRRHRA